MTKLKVGDRVAGAPLLPCMACEDCQKGNYSLCKFYSFIGSRKQGSFGDYVKMPEKNAVKFEANVSYEQGAFFEPSTVALHGLNCLPYRRMTSYNVCYTKLLRVCKQIHEKGFCFTLTQKYQNLLAKKIRELVPSSEMSIFLKTGSDATTASIRIARAHTGKLKVMRCGYHGWHDWCVEMKGGIV